MNGDPPPPACCTCPFFGGGGDGRLSIDRSGRGRYLLPPCQYLLHHGVQQDFRATHLHGAHQSSLGPDDAQGLGRTKLLTSPAGDWRKLTNVPGMCFVLVPVAVDVVGAATCTGHHRFLPTRKAFVWGGGRRGCRQIAGHPSWTWRRGRVLKAENAGSSCQSACPSYYCKTIEARDCCLCWSYSRPCWGGGGGGKACRCTRDILCGCCWGGGMIIACSNSFAVLPL